LLVALDKRWPDRNDVPESERAAYSDKVKTAKPIRLITKGGDLFLAAPSSLCTATGHVACPLCDGKRAIQADLNAAANIGLRALIDPDFSGKWWYVPCIEDKAAGIALPRTDKVKGSACFGPDSAMPEKFGSLTKPPPVNNEGQAKGRKSRSTKKSESDGKETTNFWSDPGSSALRNAADGGFWLPTTAYWRWVRKRVVAALLNSNGLRTGLLDLEADTDQR